MALDLGKRRIGLAISDELKITAQGLATLERTQIRQDFSALARLADEKGVSLVLIGRPVNMNGTEGRQVAFVQRFADDLHARTGLAVEFWDERLTSVEAGRVLRQSGISIEKRARAVDRLSAVLLLQSYLDALSLRGTDEPETRGE